MLLTLAGVALLVATLYILIPFVLEKLRVIKLASKIPGPSAGTSFLGSVLPLAKTTDNEAVWSAIKEVLYGCNKILRIWFGPVLVVAVDDPAYANVICTHSKSTTKHPWYEDAYYFQHGVFTTNGPHYERLQKALSLRIDPKKVTNWHDYMAFKSVQATQVLDKLVGKGEFDIMQLIFDFFLDLTCVVLLDFEPNEMLDRKFNYMRPLKELFATTFRRMFKLHYRILHMITSGRHYATSCVDLNVLPLQILDRRLKELEEKGINWKSDEFQIEDYTDTIIKIGAERGLSKDEMARMLGDIPAAGSDAPATVAAFALLFLAMHPEYQEEAYNEQMAVMGDEERAPTIEELGRMTFLSWIEKEVQRLQAPPLIARLASDDMTVGEYTVPKGTTLLVLINKMHRNPDIYENPDEFNPHRFSPENIAKRPKYSFLPMSRGARGCPGGLFAHLATGTLLSLLLRKYEFSTSLRPHEVRYKYALLLESATGYPISITRRI